MRQIVHAKSLGTGCSDQSGFMISASQQRCSHIAAKRQCSGCTRLGMRQAGFTIVELMIATLVFSMVLLVITVGVLHFTNSYYKGVNSSATQTAAQNAIDTISQTVQFSSNTPSAGTPATGAGTDGNFCVGSKLFLYTLGKEYGTAAPAVGNWGLYMIDNPNTASCVGSGLTPAQLANGVELLAANMRVTNLSVANSNPTTNLWQIALGIAYGDADLLCNTSQNGNTGGCSPGDQTSAATANVSGADIACKSQTGSQFCSVAALSTVAQQRISQ